VALYDNDPTIKFENDMLYSLLVGNPITSIKAQFVGFNNQDSNPENPYYDSSVYGPPTNDWLTFFSTYLGLDGAPGSYDWQDFVDERINDLGLRINPEPTAIHNDPNFFYIEQHPDTANDVDRCHTFTIPFTIRLNKNRKEVENTDTLNSPTFSMDDDEICVEI
jgi:hypothetical protein